MTLSTAMIFAAGLGTRMRAYAPDRPKPLVTVAGKPLITHTLDHLEQDGIARAIINLGWKGPMLREALADRRSPSLFFSEEGEAPLETAGGLLHARPLLGGSPFLAVNSDILWKDLASQPPLTHQLAEIMGRHDAHAVLALIPREEAHGYTGNGDFFLESFGHAGYGPLRARSTQPEAPFVFGGIQCLHPRLLDTPPFQPWDGRPLSLSVLYRTLAGDARFLGLIHRGGWHHVGDGPGVSQAESWITHA